MVQQERDKISPPYARCSNYRNPLTSTRLHAKWKCGWQKLKRTFSIFRKQNEVGRGLERDSFKWESRASGFVCSTRVTTFTAGPGQHARRRFRPTACGSLFPVTDQSEKRKGWGATVDGPFNRRNRLRTRKVVRHSQLSTAVALDKWWATCRSASRKAQPGKETIPVCFMGCFICYELNWQTSDFIVEHKWRDNKSKF